MRIRKKKLNSPNLVGCPTYSTWFSKDSPKARSMKVQALNKKKYKVLN
jgi:hypothetical protein